MKSRLTLCLCIPSVNRQADLRKALEAASANGGGLIDEVIVVSQRWDVETQNVAREFEALTVLVDEPGLAQAMKAGAAATECQIIAFSDDDAQITKNWAEELLSTYLDLSVAAVGGVDRQIHGSAMRYREKWVGRVTIFGKVSGGHHLATGNTRYVDHLKGANMSFLTSAFRHLDFQTFISGSGAQSRNELIACLLLKKQGYKVALNPRCEVNHFPAKRPPDDLRTGSVAKAFEATFNERMAFRLSGDRRGLSNFAYILFVGYPASPGLMRLRRNNFGLVAASLRGLFWACKTPISVASKRVEQMGCQDGA